MPSQKKRSRRSRSNIKKRSPPRGRSSRGKKLSRSRSRSRKGRSRSRKGSRKYYISMPNSRGVWTRRQVSGLRLNLKYSRAGADKKYGLRNSPPYKANQYCGAVKRGNDGNWYRSVPNYKGICRWVKA